MGKERVTDAVRNLVRAAKHRDQLKRQLDDAQRDVQNAREEVRRQVVALEGMATLPPDQRTLPSRLRCEGYVVQLHGGALPPDVEADTAVDVAELEGRDTT